MRSLCSIILYRYAKDRSQLGLKAIHTHLPQEKQNRIQEIYEYTTPSNHKLAVKKITTLIMVEFNWIQRQLEKDNQTIPFLKLMMETFSKEDNNQLNVVEDM